MHMFWNSVAKEFVEVCRKFKKKEFQVSVTIIHVMTCFNTPLSFGNRISNVWYKLTTNLNTNKFIIL